MTDLLIPDGSAPPDGESEWSADELIPFGKYMLLDRISGGATSAVYRANVRGEAGFERLVAIKRILPHMAGDPEFVKTFVREAKTIARLTHANICPIYELGKVGESLYMAIEYVAGKDLGKISRRLEKREIEMPPTVCAFIAARLCDALDYAHNLRTMAGEPATVVHRDLSPTNILVSYEGQVKLIDFGLAKAVGRAQQTNVDALKRKLGYMSPEMVKGRQLDARSDIFGVGVILYELLTARRLFVGKDDIDTLKLVGQAQVPPPSSMTDDVPDELEVVVMRALEREPADRWQSAAEMGHTLNAYIQKADPGYNTQRLSDWMAQLFSQDMARENERIKRLLAASSDAQIVNDRRKYFASPTGAAARARAEVQRRLSTEPPPMRPSPAPGPARIQEPEPKVVLTPRPPPPARLPPKPVRSRPFEDEPTAHYDLDKTIAVPADVHEAETRVHPQPDTFEDEPTRFTGEPVRADGGFSEEATQYLADLEVEALKIEPDDTGGFDEEPTHIFFNKEEGIGVPSLLDEINDVDEAPRGLNRPIVAQDLALPPITTEDSVFPAPPPAGMQPQPSYPQPQASYAQAPGGYAQAQGGYAQAQPSYAPPAQAQAGYAQAQPSYAPPAQALPQQGHAYAEPAALPRERAVTPYLDRNAQQARRAQVWLTIAAIAMLVATAGIVLFTPVGEPLAVALGLRPPPHGAIEVRTDPEVQADVLLDGIFRGRAPLRLDRVPIGERRLDVRAKGYVPSSRAVEVKGESTTPITISLVAERPPVPPPAPVPAPAPASPPTGTTATEGAQAAPPTAAEPAPAPTPDRSRSRRKRGGWPAMPETAEGPTPSPSPTPPAPPPAPMQQTGTLVINAIPWAYVFIDGRDIGRTTPVMGYAVAPGEHQITLRTASGATHSQRVTVQAGQTARIIQRF